MSQNWAHRKGDEAGKGAEYDQNMLYKTHNEVINQNL